MSNLTIFKFENSKVRVQLKNNEPWFCLIDICKILEIKNTSDVKKRLNESYLAKSEVVTPYGNKEALFIAEPNLYELVFCSNKPEAVKFKKWVFEEVLPQIRKTGSYGQQQLVLEKPKELPRWVTGWEIDGLHDFIKETAENNFLHYGFDARAAIIMRIKYELGLSTFERKTGIRQAQFDKAFQIAYKISEQAIKFSDQAKRNEEGFIRDNIKGLGLKV